MVVLCRGATSIIAGHAGRATVMARYRARFSAKARVVQALVAAAGVVVTTTQLRAL